MVNCLSKLMYNQIFHLFISFSSLVTATHKERSLEVINNFVSCVVLIFSTTAPAGAPEMFVAAAGERQVTFSWSPPPVALRNGVITSYTLSCSPSTYSLPLSPSQPDPLTVAGFSPDTSYSCSVVASNSHGSGPPANTSFATQQDRETGYNPMTR